jgi:phosphatidylinositol alpha-mannosyltransferase
MRVALVTEFYYPHLGGVTEHVHHLARELQSLGHDALIVTARMRGRRPDPPHVRRIGTSCVIFKNGSFARMAIGRHLARDIAQILCTERIDLVHVHSPLCPLLGLLAPAVANRLGVPVVATFHSWFPRSLPYRVLRAPLQRQLDRIAAKIAVSTPVVDALSRYFRADWTVIPNGIDVGYFHPNGRRPEDAFARGPRLLFLGRLDPRNGLETVLAAVPRILKRYPDMQLVVAGDGPLRRYYERRAKLVSQHVRFIGRVDEERPELYGSADLYVCPTTKASFGITLLEAMACGTPILGSDITGFRELVNGGREAILVPVGDAKAWAERVIELIASPERRAAMASAGLEKSIEYRWPRVAERVLEVYEKVAR